MPCWLGGGWRREMKKQLNNKIILISISLFIVFGFLFIKGQIEQNLFFKKYPDGRMFWNSFKADFFNSLTNNFLGENINLKIYTTKLGMNYWQASSENNDVGIDTIIGCNPYLKNYYAELGSQFAVVDKKGVLHYIQDSENLGILAELYNIKKRDIVKYNRISLFTKLKKGDIVFIPDVKPKVLTKEMYYIFQKRKMFMNPVIGWYTTAFGWNYNSKTGGRDFHKGIDIKAENNSPIKASADGKVVYADWSKEYGKLIIISHTNGYKTYYAHCSKIFVTNNQIIRKNELIGRVGKTGSAKEAHLHFEIRSNDKPMNPAGYFW